MNLDELIENYGFPDPKSIVVDYQEKEMFGKKVSLGNLLLSEGYALTGTAPVGQDVINNVYNEKFLDELKGRVEFCISVNRIDLIMDYWFFSEKFVHDSKKNRVISQFMWNLVKDFSENSLSLFNDVKKYIKESEMIPNVKKFAYLKQMSSYEI